MKIINVTESDIKLGRENSNKGRHPITSFCPVALALQRGTKDKNAEMMYSQYQVAGVVYRAPKEVMEWVRNFDAQENVSPFSFEIPL